MAKTLKEILSPENIKLAIDKVKRDVATGRWFWGRRIVHNVTILPEQPPCSPYCDHTRGQVDVKDTGKAAWGEAFGYYCSHCGRRYE